MTDEIKKETGMCSASGIPAEGDCSNATDGTGDVETIISNDDVQPKVEIISQEPSIVTTENAEKGATDKEPPNKE